MRVYAELKPLLDRDAIVVIDAGDFGSYAGRVIDSYVPGAWLDSGPFGCLGSGPGYALAAKLARPDRQVVLLQGDGAFGFSGMEWDTLVRHGVHVVSVIGNNGIWALEKHPMEMLYGYSVVAELRPGTRYDEVVTALGGHGELVSTPARGAACAGAGLLVGAARRGQHADRPDGRIPPPLQPGLTSARERPCLARADGTCPRANACLHATRRYSVQRCTLAVKSLDAIGIGDHAGGMEVRLHDSVRRVPRDRGTAVSPRPGRRNTIELTLLRAGQVSATTHSCCPCGTTARPSGAGTADAAISVGVQRNT